MSISMIAALGSNRAIGSNNKIPWHLPKDFEWFKRHTLGKPVIMGRKTFESIGHALPGRHNIVVTTSGNCYENADTCATPDDAINSVAMQYGEIMIIGGAQIYDHFLPRANRLYLTLVDIAVDGDAFFPDYDQYQWTETYRCENAACEQYKRPAYTFLILDRTNNEGVK